MGHEVNKIIKQAEVLRRAAIKNGAPPEIASTLAVNTLTKGLPGTKDLSLVPDETQAVADEVLEDGEDDK